MLPWRGSISGMPAERSLELAMPDAGGLENCRPSPFREFVLKIHSRCDLACDYCYMYARADQSWRASAGGMSPPMAGRPATGFGGHARGSSLGRPGLILRGGEP